MRQVGFSPETSKHPQYSFRHSHNCTHSSNNHTTIQPPLHPPTHPPTPPPHPLRNCTALEGLLDYCVRLVGSEMFIRFRC